MEDKNTSAFAGFGRSGLRFLQLLRLTSLWLKLLHNKTDGSTLWLNFSTDGETSPEKMNCGEVIHEELGFFFFKKSCQTSREIHSIGKFSCTILISSNLLGPKNTQKCNFFSSPPVKQQLCPAAERQRVRMDV